MSKATQTVLVTGSSSGIGRATRDRFAAAGWTVYAGVRDLTPDPDLPANVRPILIDVADPAQIRAAVARIDQDCGGLDALVNNAGTLTLGAFEDMPARDWQDVMTVNFFGPVELTRQVLPLMRRKRSGVVVMLSSLSGLVGLPGNSAYTASKFALEGATESLRHEVARFGIAVALVQPGAIATEMPQKLKIPDDYQPDSPYLPMLTACLPDDADEGRGDSPDMVAKVIFDIVATKAPKLRYPAGAQAEAVTAKIPTLDDAARSRFIRDVSGLDWWTAGADAPLKTEKATS
ncbi:SDR family oxidoreductase [Govanella unica]|uniref:SDR family oxidoreductase n=1 Tax=Govanella unica TaxID=2975056 RepID=A0A9X3TVZ8_9PROT|nr:SDR family oxidoreductase [Govania unica]MDA5192683.1 SDR family oxidoreductase [Govania unica]